MKKVGRVAKGLVGAGLLGLAVNQTQALDTNFYFQTVPRDMDPNTPGIQWIRGAGASNQFDVLISAGVDMPSSVKIAGISFSMSDFDGNAGTNYKFVSADFPDPVNNLSPTNASTNPSDIFFGQAMDSTANFLYLNSSTNNNRLIDRTAGAVSVDASTLINNPKLYGTWWETVGPAVSLGTLTNVAKTLASYVITLDDESASTYSSSKIVRLPTPSYQLEDAIATPEPSSAALFGIGLGLGALARSRYRGNRKISDLEKACGDSARDFSGRN